MFNDSNDSVFPNDQKQQCFVMLSGVCRSIDNNIHIRNEEVRLGVVVRGARCSIYAYYRKVSQLLKSTTEFAFVLSRFKFKLDFK